MNLGNRENEKRRYPASTLMGFLISLRSLTDMSRESLRIVTLTPRWKPWWRSLMCFASLL